MDKELGEYYSSNPELESECILRTFYQQVDMFESAFRLEVVTTPDDSKVIAWNIIED